MSYDLEVWTKRRVFNNGAEFQQTWRGMEEAAFAESLLALLDKHIPEALPYRYGPHSPPPHNYERTGKKHLVQFLSAPREKSGSHVNWQCKLPVIYVNYYIPEPWAWQEFKAYGSHRYNTGYFQIQLIADKYQPDSPRIKQFWTECTSLMRCFYSEVRFLQNQRFTNPKRPYDGLDMCLTLQTNPVLLRSGRDRLLLLPARFFCQRAMYGAGPFSGFDPNELAADGWWTA